MSTENVMTLSGATMGTRFSAHIPIGQCLYPDTVQNELQAAVNAVDQQMSPWIDLSVVNQINRAKVGVWIELPDLTRQVISDALQVEDHSQGAFSISVGAIVDHFGFSKNEARPDDQQAPDAPPMARDCLELDGSRIRKTQAVHIDLCGIAKGFGVDELARVLDRNDVKNYLVSIDGELCSRGEAAPGRAWKVALEKPVPGVRQSAWVFDCHDLSLATSGGYRQFRDSADQVVSHTICPRSGRPLSSTNISVTVAHENCCDADAWATALMVAGPENAMDMAEQYQLHALFLTQVGDQTSSQGTGIFESICLEDLEPAAG